MILAGYFLIPGYVFAMIYGVGGLLSKRVNTETSRKVIHTSLFMVWVLLDLFMRNTIHQIIIPIIFVVLNALSYKFKFYKGVEREDDNHLGTVYFALAITAIMALAYFFPALYPCTGVAAFCLTFGDGFAALIGYNFRSRKLRDHKSLYGFLACFIASLVSLVAYNLIWNVGLHLGAVVLIAAVAAIMELVENGMDNFSVTFTTFGLCYAFLVAGSAALYWGVAIAVAVFLLVFLSKAITYWGSVLAVSMVFCFTFFGGAVGILFFMGCYLSIFVVGIVSKKLHPRDSSHARGFLQILINGGLGTAAVVAYGVTGHAQWLLVAMVSIGGNFIDSVSSDVGVLSSAQPYDLLRKSYVQRGISGGMTWLGTGAACIFSLLIGVGVTVGMKLPLWWIAVAGGLTFLQTLVDTVLGSALQVKYRCTVCGAETEKKLHCDKPAEYLRGCRLIDNNTVNTISSLLLTAISAVVIWALM